MQERFTVNKRLLSETLARYSDTFAALCELLTNAIQADATRIELQIDYTPFSELAISDIKQIIILDNGIGVQKSELRWKILEVATEAKKGGKGIGRFATLQMASHLRIETVAFDQIERKFFKTELETDSSSWTEGSLEKIPVDVEYTPLDGQQKPYYKVTISDFYGPEITSKYKHKRIHRNLHEQQIGPALFAAYPEQIFEGKVLFTINGKQINPDDFIIGGIEKKGEKFTALDGKEYPMDFQFIQVKSFGKHRVSLRVANDNIRTVAHAFEYSFEMPEPNQWFILIDSPYFDEATDVFRNLDFREFDQSADHLINEIKKHVDTFFAAKYEKYKDFVKKLRADSFYPYRREKASSESRSIVFDQLAFYLEERHRLLTGKQNIRELVYALLDKTMDNREFELVLSEAIKLDKESLSKFKSLLERAKLEDVIAFSEEVCRKQQFLDFLHELNYAGISKKVKERSELHKIVEKHLWVFGEQYNGTPRLFSDKNLQNSLKALRDECFPYERSKEHDNFLAIDDEDVNNITDLFFFNENIVSDQEREIMVVELKAPKVRLSPKELLQATKYAVQIEEQGAFPKGHRYKVILVGSAIGSLAKRQCGNIDPLNSYLFYRSKDYHIEAWAVEWSELIARNKKKLSYLGNALNTKDKNASAMIEEEFKDVNLTRLKSELGRTTARPKKDRTKKAA